MKHRLNKIWINIKLYAGLPHFWISGLIIVLSIISFTISVIYYDNNPFVSSVFANIFAGLVTGIVISLISTIKSITLYRTECLIEWLDLLHKEILVYIGMYQKMMFWNRSNRDEEAFYNHIYDTLSYGNNINVTISQGRFNSSLPFNSYKYIKKEFAYDCTICSNNNEILREQIMQLDVSVVTNNELMDLFNEMHTRLTNLNSEIINRTIQLKARRKAINISFM